MYTDNSNKQFIFAVARKGYTVLRINDIIIQHDVDKLPEIEGVEGKIF